jgi:hypothetical protein
MARELSNASDPLDANLEKVLPGLHQWHRITKDEISSLRDSVQSLECKLESKIDRGIERINGSIQSQRQQSDRELANTFLNIAKSLMERSGSIVCEDMTLPAITNNATQETTATTNNNNGEGDPDKAPQLLRMVPKHSNLVDLIHEWFGTGDFYDEFGGVEGRNKSFKTQWRKNCGMNAMQYSRTERTVRAVEEYARKEKCDIYKAAEQLQRIYAVDCKKSVTNFVSWAQQQNYIPKKKSRGKKAAATAAGTAMELE